MNQNTSTATPIYLPINESLREDADLKECRRFIKLVWQTGKLWQSRNLPVNYMGDNTTAPDFRTTLQNHYCQKAISWFADNQNQATLQEAFPTYLHHNLAASLYHYVWLRDKLFHWTAKLTMMIDVMMDEIMLTPKFEELNQQMMKKTQQEKGMLQSDPLPHHKEQGNFPDNPIIFTKEPIPVPPPQLLTPYPPPRELSPPFKPHSPAQPYTEIIDKTTKWTILGVPYNFCTCLPHSDTHLNMEKKKEKQIGKNRKKGALPQSKTRNDCGKSSSSRSASSTHYNCTPPRFNLNLTCDNCYKSSHILKYCWHYKCRKCNLFAPGHEERDCKYTWEEDSIYKFDNKAIHNMNT